MPNIFPIPALKDNYIWCLHNNSVCVIVDPGVASPVIQALEAQSLTLALILVTHHHYDHTNGIEELLRYKRVPVYGPTGIPQVTHAVNPDSKIEFKPLDLNLNVIAIPGHTIEHVAYSQPGLVFTGDTLFTGGCGRIFEGTAAQMYHSLEKIKSLPEDTLIYCGHEYTENNLRFAQVVEPHNPDIKKRFMETKTLRSKNLPTVPATLAIENKTNPFLRCEEPEVIVAATSYCGRSLYSPVDVLAVLREWKNSF